MVKLNGYVYRLDRRPLSEVTDLRGVTDEDWDTIMVSNLEVEASGIVRTIDGARVDQYTDAAGEVYACLPAAVVRS